ncbi:MAG: DUF4157 domain-containing protein, partial [Bacteroidota bacterium]
QSPSQQPFFQKEGGQEAFFSANPIQTSLLGSPPSDQSQPFFSPFIQPKLSIGQPNDRYEQEADAVADQVVQRMKQPISPDTISQVGSEQAPQIQQKPLAISRIQRKPIFETRSEEAMPVQRKAASVSLPGLQLVQEESHAEEENLQEGGEERQEQVVFDSAPPPPEEPNLQTSSGSPQTATPSLENQLNSSKGGGSPLPEDTRSGMEDAIGSDFSGVRIHTDSSAVQMNQDLGAQAFTHGNDIYFNSGKYDPGSESGQHLLAHELTHTVQQGGGGQRNLQKRESTTQEIAAPTTALEITREFRPDQAWENYLNSHKSGARVWVKIGNDYEGHIYVNQKKIGQGGNPGVYQLDGRKSHKNHLKAKGIQFLDAINGVEPILILNKFGEDRKTTGYVSVTVNGRALRVKKGLIEQVRSNMDALGMLGVQLPNLKGIGIHNEFSDGLLKFNITGLSANINGFLEAGGGIGISGNQLTFDVTAKVTVPGVAEGDFNLKMLPTGKLDGRAEINADIANVNAILIVEYLNGEVTIKGTGNISSEKFSGSISFLVTDKKKANDTMYSELGVERVEKEKNKAAPPKSPQPTVKTPRNQVLVGWGTVTATITPWLEGTAKIGISHEAHITMVGEIVMPDQVELMEKRGVKKTLFDVKIKAGYGVPLVGQVYLFTGIELFINAGFGPLVLKDVGMSGTYSTDPAVRQNFTITGTLNINAFAILGLKAKGGVGLTLLGHDIEAGVAVTAAAGIKA